MIVFLTEFLLEGFNYAYRRSPSPVNGVQTEQEGPSKINGASSDKEKQKKKDRKTPEVTGGTTSVEPSNSGVLGPTSEVLKDSADDSKSPGDGSAGTRTPKYGKPQRHPWTIFMRMTPQIQVTEDEVRDFFGEAKDGITRVNFPHSFPGKPKLAYVEFGDDEALKAGLDKHAEVCIEYSGLRLISWTLL